MDFETLRILAWIKIGRSSSTEQLYVSEDRVKDAVDSATDELAKFWQTKLDAEHLTLSRDEVIALELCTTLAHYGSAGCMAAQLIVDRYGLQDPQNETTSDMKD